MKIISLELEGLHGYISHKIDFYDDLSILVGINGSGKTSIFHLIDNILQLNLPKLCTTKLSSAKLVFLKDAKNHQIYITQTPKKLNIELTVNSKKFFPIFADLIEDPKKLASNPELSVELLERYARYGPDKEEKETWDYLKGLNKPAFVSLDRKILNDDDDIVFFSATTRRENLSTEHNGPVIKSLNASKSAYTKYRNALKQLNDELIKDIALALFDDEMLFGPQKRVKKISELEIERLEKRVLSHPSFLSENDKKTRERIHNHFSLTKNLMTESAHIKGSSELRMLLSQRLHSITKSIDAFDKFESTASLLAQPIQRYLEALNAFFNGSNKRIFFDDTDNSLYFESKDDPDLYRRDVTTLSSGEKQLFILLSYLAFVSDKSGILMIDEPELSLHPIWQKRFIHSIESLRPANCQVILATHSPEIAGPRKEKTILLKQKTNV